MSWAVSSLLGRAVGTTGSDSDVKNDQWSSVWWGFWEVGYACISVQVGSQQGVRGRMGIALGYGGDLGSESCWNDRHMTGKAGLGRRIRASETLVGMVLNLSGLRAFA